MTSTRFNANSSSSIWDHLNNLDNPPFARGTAGTAGQSITAGGATLTPTISATEIAGVVTVGSPATAIGGIPAGRYLLSLKARVGLAASQWANAAIVGNAAVTSLDDPGVEANGGGGGYNMLVISAVILVGDAGGGQISFSFGGNATYTLRTPAAWSLIRL
ncbi:MAG: hypothetical protein CVT66_06305 [Actinobacteria bacterium HGW-Actinobacteria-6]|nr:MAG: hypothetical protein CVT66_06305 [Actinobacteria bacterium HGW-Actinobacteria-6]